MNKMWMVLALCSLVFTPVQAEDNALLPEKLIDIRTSACPVMCGPTRENCAVIHEGKIYHFCCP